MIARMFAYLLIAACMSACGRAPEDAHAQGEHAHATEGAPFERGPHGGRMLREGGFAVELVIFEENTHPEFRLYAFRGDVPVPPADVQASVRLTRLDGASDTFEFQPADGFLLGNGVVQEPHSFDVTVTATHAGRQYEWSYQSYEGRVVMAAATAAEAGVETQIAGPGTIRDAVNLVGTVVLNPDRHAHLKARFPGTVRSVHAQLGDRVRRGQPLLVIEANESMREYPVTAPFDGIVLARETNIGDVTGEHALIEIADLSQVWVELHALGEQSTRIRPEQAVIVRSATTSLQAETRVSAVLPLATRGQSVIIRARLDNPEGQWRPGMTVSGEVTVSKREVPLAVRESALQRFREFDVVFAKVGETYEVRMLELGARDGDFVEVLSGLAPGTEYVTEQSFLIKADIEKSGAVHEH